MNIDTLISHLCNLNVRDSKKLFTLYLSRCSESHRDTLVQVLETEVYRDRYRHATLWMEKRFEKDISKEPRQVAYSYIAAVGCSKRAFPWLLRLARKAKKRVDYRLKAQHKSSSTRVHP